MTQSDRVKLRRLLKDVVFARDKYKCLRCRRQVTLAPAHIYPKGAYRKLEFEIKNVITLCYPCHFSFAHKDPLEFTDWLNKNIPWIEELKEMKKNDVGLKLDYNLIKLYLEQELKKYGN